MAASQSIGSSAAPAISVEIGQQIAKGDRLLVMEAMKMQSTIYAPVAGKVTQKLVNIGDKVESKDLLIVIQEATPLSA